MATAKGFEVNVYDRNRSNKEKKVDTSIAYLMGKDANTIANKDNDTITLVAGDSDYASVVSDLVADGFKVHVVFWKQAAFELKTACTRFFELDQHIDHLKF